MVAAVEQLSLALSNLRLQDSLRTQSIRDPLTGLYNRRYLEESLTRELARCDRVNKPLSVLMIDLDHFKRFNDTHGHDGGDALLTHAGRVFQAHCRAEDIACRYGGEEFTLILPEVDAERARQRAEEIRLAVEKLDVQHRRERLSSVTTSIGVGTFPDNARAMDELLRRADAALYKAKQQGRNRVVLD
jgi:diguanylate cyclase (GGDEF)-like protein